MFDSVFYPIDIPVKRKMNDFSKKARLLQPEIIKRALNPHANNPINF
jgi:hypothetical protein